MDLGLKGKIALVTGASRGIGHRIARTLGVEGARLVVCARNVEGLDAALADFEEIGVEVEGVATDVMETAGADKVVQVAQRRFGGLDIVVNNVGGSVWTTFADITDDEWAHVFNLSFFSAVRTTRAAWPLLETAGGGSVVNISSIFGREIGGPISYNAAKSAMISMTANLAQEAAPKNIRINTVAPGSIIFPGGSWERRMKENPEKIQAFIDENIAFGRFGTPEEVADVVAFLASPRGSWVTGACLNVDGGQSRSLI